MTVDVKLFGEDAGHESFCVPLVKRVAAEFGHSVHCDVRSAAGGRAALLKELRTFAERAIIEGTQGDLLVVATDANCKGRAVWESAVRDICDELVLQAEDRVVTLCPDPHVERWMLVDSAAFKAAFGRGCSAPKQKCAKAHYKQLLVAAILETGVEPVFGGMEFADEVVAAMDLDAMLKADDSLGRGITDLRRCFKAL